MSSQENIETSSTSFILPECNCEPYPGGVLAKPHTYVAKDRPSPASPTPSFTNFRDECANHFVEMTPTFYQQEQDTQDIFVDESMQANEEENESSSGNVENPGCPPMEGVKDQSSGEADDCVYLCDVKRTRRSGNENPPSVVQAPFGERIANTEVGAPDENTDVVYNCNREITDLDECTDQAISEEQQDRLEKELVSRCFLDNAKRNEAFGLYIEHIERNLV
ncbi:MAG: hypothetical protein Q8O46_01635 [bacterium]|nr:hypothetical protein [bacterium]